MAPDESFIAPDPEKALRDLANLSDADLSRLMLGEDLGAASKPRPAGRAAPIDESALEPGQRVKGAVLEIQRDAILVELDQKTLGLIDRLEFEEKELPLAGTVIEAEVVRRDRERGLWMLTARGVQREVTWQSLRPGVVVDGKVVEANKGGLVFDLKGLRGFMPISQIELGRVEDLAPYVGRTLRCEVREVQREDGKIVLTRRPILEREGDAERAKAIASFRPGDVVHGRIVRVNEHGAFVNLGHMDGLLPQRKIQERLKSRKGVQPLLPGQLIEVEVTHVDAERKRVSLDFRAVQGSSWQETSENYHVGDLVTAWVARIRPEGSTITLEPGLDAELAPEASSGLRPGELLRVRVAKVDRAAQRITVERA